MAKHNKKRNVGLIHEQLVRYISECIVNQNQNLADVAIKILEKNFHKKSELYREFRLFNSLVHTRVPVPTLARRIIEESRAACQKHSASNLAREKSVLIRDINHGIDKSDFYGRRIVEYKIFATVQALLNEWRGKGRLYPEEMVEYEAVLEEWLAREVKPPRENSEADPLVLNLMIEKFNKKYGDRLSDDQRQMLAAKLTNDDEKVVRCIGEIKHRAALALNRFYNDCENNFLLGKRDIIMERISSLEVDPSDLVVERALSLAALIEELESEDER